jgi:hypothetical protein
VPSENLHVNQVNLPVCYIAYLYILYYIHASFLSFGYCFFFFCQSCWFWKLYVNVWHWTDLVCPVVFFVPLFFMGWCKVDSACLVPHIHIKRAKSTILAKHYNVNKQVKSQHMIVHCIVFSTLRILNGLMSSWLCASRLLVHRLLQDPSFADNIWNEGK